MSAYPEKSICGLISETRDARLRIDRQTTESHKGLHSCELPPYSPHSATKTKKSAAANGAAVLRLMQIDSDMATLNSLLPLSALFFPKHQTTTLQPTQITSSCSSKSITATLPEMSSAGPSILPPAPYLVTRISNTKYIGRQGRPPIYHKQLYVLGPNNTNATLSTAQHSASFEKNTCRRLMEQKPSAEASYELWKLANGSFVDK